jgi:hypothetical protein
MRFSGVGGRSGVSLGGAHAMEESTQVGLLESVEDLIRGGVRDFVEQVIEDELTQILERGSKRDFLGAF